MDYKADKKIKSQRRKDILNAAKKLFAKHGYSKTTMRQIVEKAKTSIGNCYFYFPNKEAILQEIAQELINYIREETAGVKTNSSSKASQLALTTYILISSLLESKLYFNLLRESSKTRLMVMGFFRRALKKFIHENPQIASGMDPKFAAIAWEGVTLILLDYIPREELETDRNKLVTFLVRWNLQAVRLSDDEVESAMQIVEDYKEKSDST